ncbi:MAG: flagellar hook-associated protein FlgK [Lachnospiraceae bacterium]|nr:flagellar hook-associated protein FlgK [Lachnospiraceae bacterium]
MSLMGAFYVGVSGLQTSQNALNTTAHNIANVDTAGYTRQQVYQGTRSYNTISYSYNGANQVGMGVAYSDVRAVRDIFMDQTYRTESGRAAYYSTNLEINNEVTTLFGEMQGVEFLNSLQDLRNAFMDLENKPTDATVQGSVIQTASHFVYRAQAVYNGLADYQDNLNEQIKDQVDQINEYAKKIAAINEQVTAIAAARIESPNDLRDARDQLLDDLSAFGRVTYSEDARSCLNIQFEGVDLVRENHYNELAVLKDKDTGFYTPVWGTFSNQPVFKEGEIISAEAGTDSGSLKAMYLARGNKRATHLDMKSQVLNDKTADPDDWLWEKSNRPKLQYDSDVFESTSKSDLCTIMAEFDNLVNGIVTQVNDWLTHHYEVIEDDEGIKDDGSGTLKYEELFVRIQHGDDFTRTNPLNPDYDYNTMNIMVNTKLMNRPTLLNKGFFLSDQSADQDTASEIAKLFQGTTDFMTLNPETKTPLSFTGYYNGIVEQYATKGNAYQLVSDAQEQLLVATDNKRQQVMGVSDNEELMKLVRFQNAYNASSRYFNTVNDMLTQMIQQLA